MEQKQITMTTSWVPSEQIILAKLLLALIAYKHQNQIEEIRAPIEYLQHSLHLHYNV